MISDNTETIVEFERKQNEGDEEVKDKDENEQEDEEAQETNDIDEGFELIYESLKELDADCSKFTRQFQDYRKVLEAQTLEEQEFYPKRHAISWFKKNKVQIPCSLENFLDAFLKEEAEKDRICSEERTVILGKRARHLFQTDKEKVSWMELLVLVPTIFE